MASKGLFSNFLSVRDLQVSNLKIAKKESVQLLKILKFSEVSAKKTDFCEMVIMWMIEKKLIIFR